MQARFASQAFCVLRQTPPVTRVVCDDAEWGESDYLGFMEQLGTKVG